MYLALHVHTGNISELTLVGLLEVRVLADEGLKDGGTFSAEHRSANKLVLLPNSLCIVVIDGLVCTENAQVGVKEVRA